MKKLLNILLIIFSSITIIFALAFTFLEARLLLSLDWSIYDNALNGFIRYLFRLLIALFSIAVCLFELINIKKKNISISKILYLFNIALFLISIIILTFATNYVGLVCIVLALSLLIIKTFIVLRK